LELCAEPSHRISRAYDLLRPGGVLLAAVHGSSSGLLAGLTKVGFVDGELVGADGSTRHRLPSLRVRDTAFVRAWKRPAAGQQLERLDALRNWVYLRLDPEQPVDSDDAVEILAEGGGWCRDYAVVLGEAARREGFHVSLVTMRAEGLPRDRWTSGIDHHAVVEVTLDDSSRHVVDPTVNVRYPHALATLLRDPRLADMHRKRDERYVKRGYDAYSTSFWYSRVARIETRASPREPGWPLPVDKVIDPNCWSRWLLAPRRRPVRRWVRAVARYMQRSWSRDGR
jgi:hypothetical protein